MNDREALMQHLSDWAVTDSAVRMTAMRVLSEREVLGDEYGVPGIEDVVELLVRKIEAMKCVGSTP